MTVTLTDQLVGQLIGGRYHVMSRIARGGMATVYLAMDQLLGRQVALKVMHPHLAEGPAGADFVARFRREAMSAARLAHPGLVAVFDQGQDGDTSYLVMEFVEGTNLRRVLAEKGPLPVGDALQTVEAVLEALAVAHAAGVIHRDIKPENVLVAADGSIKVADFGLARAMAEASSTSTGTVLGSVAYLAPELVAFGSSDERTDLYSVGILLYELITGQQPFEGTSPLQIAYQHVNVDVAAPSLTVEWLPTEVDDLVAALSARAPSDRPADAAAALDRVRRTRTGLDTDVLSRRAGSVTRGALARLGPNGVAAAGSLDVATDSVASQRSRSGRHEVAPATEPETTEAPTEPKRRRRLRWALIPVAVVAAMALGMTGWWYMSSGPGAYTTVPDVLLGHTAQYAENALIEAGLAVSTVEVFHPTRPAGEVLTVVPPEGSKILKDGEVALTVSKGPDMREVTIAAAGLPLEDVTSALTDAGFTVPPAVMIYSDTVPAGTVLSITDADGNPVDAGATYPVGSEISITCSDGLEPVTIPNVVGLSRDDGVATLEGLGLKFTEEQAYHASIPAGVIKAQSPAAESAGFRLDTVHIVVSKGPQPPPPPPAPPAGSIKVPNLVGMYKYPAWSTIYDLGFKGSHIDDNCTLGYDHCVVASQSPAAGTYLPKDSLITIYLKDE